MKPGQTPKELVNDVVRNRLREVKNSEGRVSEIDTAENFRTYLTIDTPTGKKVIAVTVSEVQGYVPPADRYRGGVTA